MMIAKLATSKSALLAGLLMAASAAQAAPIDVSYTTTGTSGAYTYDFSVTNNLGGTNDIYFFGVLLGARDITGSPAGWNPDIFTSYNPQIWGGPSIDFNNVWIFGNIAPGQSVSGFKVGAADAIAATSVQWYAFAWNGTYTGGGNFNYSGNPGFAGTATSNVAAVPEPATWAMMIAGFGAVGFSMRSRSRVSKVQYA